MTELQKIKTKQIQLIYDKYYSSAPTAEAPELIASCDDGTYFYEDIDYTCQLRTGQWSAAKHYTRLEKTLVFGGKELLQRDCARRERLLGALKYWLKHDFINPNWWHNQIGMPKVMANIALLLEEYLSPQMKEGLKKLISRGVLGKDTDLPDGKRARPVDCWTGANLIWGAATTVKHALFTEDEALLRIAVDRIAGEIRFAAEEGIREDGAFCQHGPRWYSGGYGRSFVYELAPLIYILQGTSFAIPEEKLNIFLLHVLDGQRTMMHRGYFDYNAVGREFVRLGDVGARRLVPAVALLVKTEALPRKNEIEAFCAEILGGESAECTRYYPSIAQLCHKKNGIYVGVRGRSEGIYGAEHCNSEGILCYNMSYGTVTCVMESGREYSDIAPLWDYSAVPGTTARREGDEELLSKGDWHCTLETSCRAFGKSWGDCGVLAEFAEHDGISLNAAYFAFGGTLVALGSEIEDSSPEKGVLYTTVEQCFASNPVIGKNEARNGALIYRNLDPETELFAKCETREGNWRRNDKTVPDSPVTGEIFTAYIPVAAHGAYAYSVSREATAKIEILRNDGAVQAILIGGKTVMAVFREDAELCIKGKLLRGKHGDCVLEEV